MEKILVPPGNNIDGFLRKFRKPGTVFILEGDYYTGGMRSFADLDYCMLAPNCSIIGDGPVPSTINFEKTPEDEGLYTEILTGGSRVGLSDSMTVKNLKIMCPTQITSVGVHLWTSSASVIDVDVFGVSGSRNQVPPNEGFGILINNAGYAIFDGGHEVRNCRVMAVSGSYVTAIYVGVEGRTLPLAQSVVSGCSAISAGEPAHCAYGLNSRTKIVGCNAVKFLRPFFSDTGGGEDGIIEDCTVYDCRIGVEIRVSKKKCARTRLSVNRCRFHFGKFKVSYVAGLVLAAESEGVNEEISGVELNDCHFINSSALTAYMGSSTGPRVSAVQVRNCHWTGSNWSSPKQGDTIGNGAQTWEID